MSGQNLFPRTPSQKDTRTRRALQRLADIPIATNIPVVVLLDNFTSGSLTALNLHTMDLGFGWSEQQSSGTTAQVEDGTNTVLFSQNGHGGNMVWTAATSQPNGTFYLGVKIPVGNSGFLGLAFRVSGSGDDLVAVIVDGINGAFSILERNASVYTTRATASLTVAKDSNYFIVATLTGTTISATLTGPSAPSSPLSYDQLTTNTTVTTHGIIAGGSTTSDIVRAVGPYKMTVP